MNTVFYCYIYYRKDGITPFYVGKGTKSRIINFANHSCWVKNILDKDGRKNIKIEIIECKDEQDAFKLENRWICIFKADGYSLCNLTEGGGGISGYSHSITAKQKISQFNKGKKLTLAQKQAVAEARTGKKASEITRERLSLSHLGNKPSEETKRKMSETHKRLGTLPPNRKK